MKIPKIPSPSINSGKAWGSDGPGKGSGARNISGEFGQNLETVLGEHKRGPGHTRIIYRNGQRIVYEDGKLIEGAE